MKQQGTLALLLILSSAALGAATSATARSKRTLQSYHDSSVETSAETLSESSFLDVSEGTSQERRVLLDRLDKAEALTVVEREALRQQQHMLVALEQEQEAQASQLKVLEAAERSASSGRVVMEQGTVRNLAAQTTILTERPQQERPQNYEVAMKKTEKVKSGSKSKDDNEFVVLIRGSEKEFWDKYNQAFWDKMYGIAMYMGQIFLVAFLYMQFCKQSVTPKLPESQVRTDEFQYGVFDASDAPRDCQMCMCACCCPWIRWAETASKEHIRFLAFIPGLFITALLAASGSVTFGASIPVLLLIVVLCRQRIRDTYGLPSGTCTIVLGDCLLWICCPCCAIVQEARQVEYVEPPMQDYGTPMMGP